VAILLQFEQHEDQLIQSVSYYYSFVLIKSSSYSKKGKAIPLQAWTVPEGSKWLRLPDFKTIGT